MESMCLSVLISYTYVYVSTLVYSNKSNIELSILLRYYVKIMEWQFPVEVILIHIQFEFDELGGTTKSSKKPQLKPRMH